MGPSELVAAYVQILRTGDLDRLDEILAPDVYDHVGRRSGIAWWKQILGTVQSAFSDTRVTVEHLLVEADLVAVHFTVSGRQTGRFLPQVGPVEPSGQPFSWQQVHIFRVADGVLAEHWAVRDDLGPAKQVAPFPRTPESMPESMPAPRLGAGLARSAPGPA